MEKYNKDRRCAMCGGSADTMYVLNVSPACAEDRATTRAVMSRKCGTCGYAWEEEPLHLTEPETTAIQTMAAPQPSISVEEYAEAREECARDALNMSRKEPEQQSQASLERERAALDAMRMADAAEITSLKERLKDAERELEAARNPTIQTLEHGPAANPRLELLEALALQYWRKLHPYMRAVCTGNGPMGPQPGNQAERMAVDNRMRSMDAEYAAQFTALGYSNAEWQAVLKRMRVKVNADSLRAEPPPGPFTSAEVKC